MYYTRFYAIWRLAAFCFLFPFFAAAQSINPEALSIDARAIYTAEGDVIVRWAPSNYKTWLWGRDSGFVLQRMTLEAADTLLDVKDMNASILTIPLPPLSQAQWEAVLETDSVVGVAASACFGDDFLVSPPGSNGGIVTAYNIESEKNNRFGLALFAADLSVLAAEMQNLYYKDESVEGGRTYSYLVRPRGVTGALQVRSGNATVRTSVPYAPPVPAELSVTPGDSVAILLWNQAATAGHYAAYDVFRSADGGATFQKVNSQPVVPMDQPDGEPAKGITYYSPLDDNTTLYQFKIRGHSPFGIEGPFTPPLSVRGVPAPLQAPVFVSMAKETASGVLIAWDFPPALNDRIQGFHVLRAAEHEGEYLPLHPGLIAPAERQYTDPAPLPTSYYEVEFVDLDGNKAASIPRLFQPTDSIAPPAPVSVQGEAVGTGGVLKIHWSPSAGSDVMGYRVFMADQPDGAYGQVTTQWTPDTVFRYKVNVSSLAERKYFRVKALDFRENTSDYSPVAAVALPDIVPPALPVMKKTEPTAEGVLVTFAPSTSSDVQAHRILRKKKDEVQWQEVAVLDSLDAQHPASWLDTSAERMYTYDYMVQAEDEAGKKSNSKVFPVKPVGSGIRETVGDLEVRFVKSEGVIRLKWKYHNAYGISGFVIYRGTDADHLYEVAAVLPGRAVTGGAYNGPNPFVAPPPGSAAASPSPTVPNGGQLSATAFDLQQAGSTNTLHDTYYEYHDKEFLKFKPYYYAVGVRYEDGTASPLSVVRSTSAY